MGFVMTLLCGAIAGWLAGKITGSSNGLIMNIILGLVGGVVGSVVLGFIGLGATGTIGGIIVAAFGACLLIWIFGKVKK